MSRESSKFKSRKFYLTLLCLCLITGFTVAGLWFTVVEALLPGYIAGILGVLSLYFTGNVWAKHVAGKQDVEMSRVLHSQQSNLMSSDYYTQNSYTHGYSHQELMDQDQRYYDNTPNYPRRNSENDTAGE